MSATDQQLQDWADEISKAGASANGPGRKRLAKVVQEMQVAAGTAPAAQPPTSDLTDAELAELERQTAPDLDNQPLT